MINNTILEERLESTDLSAFSKTTSDWYEIKPLIVANDNFKRIVVQPQYGHLLLSGTALSRLAKPMRWIRWTYETGRDSNDEPLLLLTPICFRDKWVRMRNKSRSNSFNWVLRRDRDKHLITMKERDFFKTGRWSRYR